MKSVRWKTISDLNRSLRARYFVSVLDERRSFKLVRTSFKVLNFKTFKSLYGGQFTLSTPLINQILLCLSWRVAEQSGTVIFNSWIRETQEQVVAAVASDALLRCSRSRARALDIKTTFVAHRSYAKILVVKVHSRSACLAIALQWFCWFCIFHRIRSRQVAFERFKLVLSSTEITPRNACILMYICITAVYLCLWQFAVLWFGFYQSLWYRKFPLNFLTALFLKDS